MAQPLILKDNYTAIAGIAPPLVSFGPNQKSYTIFNATQATIKTDPYTSGTSTANFISPGKTIILNQDPVTGKWIQETSSTTIPSVSITENIQNPSYVLPVASAGLLGGMKVGGNLSIAPDGTLSAQSGSSASFPTTASLGIATSGVDQTTALNNAMLNPSYKGIIVDFIGGGKATVSGTFNGQGKTIIFMPGSSFAGSGIINNFFHSSGHYQQCYDTTLTVNPTGCALDEISPWVYGMNTTASGAVNALAAQVTVDMCIRCSAFGGGVTVIRIPTGTYAMAAPLIIQRFAVSNMIYNPHQITIKGDTNFSQGSGYGTVLNFSFNDRFGIGIQGSKGGKVTGLKLTGGWVDPGNAMSAYTFYSTTIAGYTDGASRDTRYSPLSGVVIDPFGPSIPADGGYPGNDAYGVALSTYYRGGTSGSTGVELSDIFLSNWVVGIITSPNGLTNNAELAICDRLQFQNLKLCVHGCQSQERLNIINIFQSWGNTHTVFATGLYGAGSVGSWKISNGNIAGRANQIMFTSESGYSPSYLFDIYAESLGTIGSFSSSLGATIDRCEFNFAYFDNGGAFQYVHGQVTGQGVTFIGCMLRIYGQGKPITINAVNGPMYFQDCDFDVAPIYNQDYPRGSCTFLNCTIGDTAFLANPYTMMKVQDTGLSGTFCYGKGKIKTDNYALSYENPVLATGMPINRISANYSVTVTTNGGGYRQAVITAGADELNRVFVNDVLVANTSGTKDYKIFGIVTAAGGGSFTVQYIPTWVTNGNYYLFVWLQFKNIIIKGDTTSGVAQINNVTILAGSFSDFTVNGQGLLQTTSFPITDTWNSKMIRLLTFTSGTITTDKACSATQTGIIFTNVDAIPDPGTPGIAAGAGAGSGPTLSIIKGNDRYMQVSVLTGSGTTTGTIATVTFGIPFAGGYVPSVRFSPANGNAAGLSDTTQIFMDATVPTKFLITSGSAALATTTTYLWNVEVN